MAEIVKIDFGRAELTEAGLDRIRPALDAGGVIAFPTDTFYGLGANPFLPEALAKIFEIKQRPADKPLLVLIPSLDWLDRLTRGVTPNARLLMERFWPGPLTLIFDAAPDLPPALTAGTGTIGIRLPAHEYTRRLLEVLDQPLTAPSANLSGEPEPRTAQEVERALGAALEWIVDGGPAPGGKLSTLLDTTTQPPTLIREGAVSRRELETVLPIQVR